MSNLNAGNCAEVRVWVMKANPLNANEVANDGAEPIYSFPWNWSNWVEARRLIPVQSKSLVGSMGDASLGLMREQLAINTPIAKRYDTRNWKDAPVIVPGCWICITAGPLSEIWPGGRVLPSAVRWWGFIDRIDGQQFGGTTEIVGTVTALEIGHLLDRTVINGWQQVGKTSSSGVGDATVYGFAPINDVPTANLSGAIEGTVIGNMGKVKGVSDAIGSTLYAFQSDMSKCATDPVASRSAFATRWRVLRHLLAFCLPAILRPAVWGITYTGTTDGNPDEPAIPSAGSNVTIPGYLNDTTVPEVIPISKQTIKGMLDLLVPQSFGLGWAITLTEYGNFNLFLFTRNAAITTEKDAFGLPVATPVTINVPDHPITTIERMQSTADMPDAVVVEGAPCMFAASFCPDDGSLGAGWDATNQLPAYQQAAKGDPGYSSLTTSQQLDRNRAIRQSPAYADVFTRFMIQPKDSATGILRVGSVGTGSAEIDACPLVIPDLTTGAVTISGSAQRSPYYPTMTLSRTLPWIVGITPAGVDKRPTSLRNWPQWMQPQVFYRDLAQPAGLQWLDLTAKGGTRPTPSVDIDDRGPALRIVYDKPERLGLGLIAFDGTHGQYDIQSESSQTEGANFFNWQKLVVTVAYPSDQRVRVQFNRPTTRDISDANRREISDDNVLRTLTVTDDTLQCWTTLKGTVLGIKTDGTPDRVTAASVDGTHYVVRNDFPRALKMARRLAAWAFRRRQGFRIELMRPDAPPIWASIGTIIGKIKETEDTGETGAPVVSSSHYVAVDAVDMVWGTSPRLTVAGEDTGMPSLGGSVSPSSGGPVSVALGGTVPQAVQAVRADVAELRAITQQVPLVPAYAPGTQSIPYRQLIIGSGNTLGTIGATTAYGIKFGASLASVPTLIPTAIDAVYPDGLSAAYDIGSDPSAVSSAKLVWVTCAGAITSRNPLGGGDVTLSNPQTVMVSKDTLVLAVASYFVPVAASPGTYASVYVIAMVGK